MERSSSSRPELIVLADRAVLVGIALGLSMYVMPFWQEGRLRLAFWLTLISSIVHVYTSHRRVRGVD